MVKNRVRHLATERGGKITDMMTATDLARRLDRLAVGEGGAQTLLAAFFPYEEPREGLA